MKKLTETTRIYTRDHIELWGAFYEYTNVFNETEIYVSDIHIIDTKNQKVIYQTFDRISYNNHDKISLVNIVENLIDAVIYLYNKKDMDFQLKKTLNDLFKKGSILNIQTYSKKQKYEDQRTINSIEHMEQKESDEQAKKELINYTKKNSYSLFIYYNRFLIIEDTKDHISIINNITNSTTWTDINNIIKNNKRYKIILDKTI